MSIENLQLMSIISFAIGGVLLVVALILFFRLDIRSVWNELSGKTAEKQIQELRVQNRKTHENKMAYSVMNSQEYVTQKIKSGKINMPQEEIDTVCLNNIEEDTMVLCEERTGVLEGTVVLSESEETTVLNMVKKTLRIDKVIVHTVERI